MQLTYRGISYQKENSEARFTSSDTPAQLKYRGVCYQNNDSEVRFTSQETEGIYRGIPWSKSNLDGAIVPRGVVQLKYRGHEYEQVI